MASCARCCADEEALNNVLFGCYYSLACYHNLSNYFQVQWVFSNNTRNCPTTSYWVFFGSKIKFIMGECVKALFQNHRWSWRIFENKHLYWIDHFKSARLNKASSWHSLSQISNGCSLQNICWMWMSLFSFVIYVLFSFDNCVAVSFEN